LGSYLLGISVLVALVPLGSQVWMAAGILLLVGIGMGGVDVGSNTLLVWLHGCQVGPYMNGMFFFAGVGAFLAPILVAKAVLSFGDVTWAYWGMALVLSLLAVGILLVPSLPRPQPAHGNPAVSFSPALVAFFSLFLFLYIGLEAVYGEWFYTRKNETSG
jgi:fucose permease